MYRDESSSDRQLWIEFYQFLACLGLTCLGAFLITCLL